MSEEYKKELATETRGGEHFSEAGLPIHKIGMTQNDFRSTLPTANQVLLRRSESVVSFLIAKFGHFFGCGKQDASRGVRMHQSGSVKLSSRISASANVADRFVRATGHPRFIIDAVEARRINGVVPITDFVENSVSVFRPFLCQFVT